MYERIVLPLDGSALAEGVLPYVEELATRCASEVLLLQAVTPYTQHMGLPAVTVTMDTARQQVEAETAAAQRYLTTVGHRLRQAGIRVQVHVVEGAPATAVLQYAGEAQASLIAMSTHGRGGLGRLAFGSVADEVLRSSRLPLLLVRSSEEGAGSR